VPYLTPDAPDGNVGRILFIPDTYLPAVNGALLALVDNWNWEQFGDETPDDATAAMLAMFQEYSLSNLESYTQMLGILSPQMRSAGSPVAWADSTGQAHGGIYGWVTNAINNFSEWQIAIPAGWALRVGFWGRSSTTAGIVTLKIDGATLGTVDYYSSPSAQNARAIIGPNTITSGGVHVLGLHTLSKNPSSTNYGMQMTEISYRLTPP